MAIISWIIFGAIAGWIASLITRTSQGIVMDIVLGIIGALIGGFIMNLLGFPGVGTFNVYSLIVAIIGAVILIAIGKALQRKY